MQAGNSSARRLNEPPTMAQIAVMTPGPTLVVNKRRSEYDVDITRGTGLNHGNPFNVKRYGRRICIELFQKWFLDKVAADPIFRRNKLALRGLTLGCVCDPLDCHGHVIAKWVDEQPIEDWRAAMCDLIVNGEG